MDSVDSTEDICNNVRQCASYSLLLNQTNEVVKCFILANGYITEIFHWKGDLCPLG